MVSGFVGVEEVILVPIHVQGLACVLNSEFELTLFKCIFAGWGKQIVGAVGLIVQVQLRLGAGCKDDACSFAGCLTLSALEYGNVESVLEKGWLGVVVANPMTSSTILWSRSWVQPANRTADAASIGMMCFIFFIL